MIISVYKPKGITSYDVIRKLKEKYPREKIGHGGTLDPLAEGVLVVGIGREGTRQLQIILKGTKKTYEATIELGKTSLTDDSEGPIINTNNSHIVPTEQELIAVLSSFKGTTLQTPPKYSAVKINGVPAYKRARRGEQFVLQPKNIIIHSIKLLKYDFPHVQIEVACESGVYIRSLARDVGTKLKVGAYVSSLIRTAVGSYTRNDSINLS
ncbi:tRNA pseudouridine(55) synthase TruB [Candidatus Roizmanbacteria bacterium CG_4_10_14_0_2_um_filter_39_13]|uniref:tRNA pseudouridine synthase B n=1 Tax=Candidatus Roizmanbacteria bacterium CG_4_10_14_0_2_um_filter_39_13 TaxID=1974825 RepID=A0A2M7TYS4_9BACT|nr:MAG: tRNA pseudouridine(55) synthase TruB [Candidatus Roizmanbacteria bacterium CG_4_10_14_0_2_um_filter_39_13]